jgi:hypothetical protein
VLEHAGAVCAAPFTLYPSNYPPTRWGTATFLPPCWESPGQRDGWEINQHMWTNHFASKFTRFNPDGFFLWGCVKNIAYQIKIDNLQHLKAHIRYAVTTVTPNMLQATWNKIKFFLDIYCATTLKLIEKVIYSEKKMIVFLCNGVTHKCV